MLPQYVRERARGKLVGMGSNPSVPGKHCRLCGKLYGTGPVDKPLVDENCSECQARLAEGESVLICEDKRVWILSKRLQNEKGQGDAFHVSKPCLEQFLNKQNEYKFNPDKDPSQSGG